ncbi:hypothetical protein [Rhizobium leguminosarum]|uniref:hypothetical protein n=1 Tax=Rhizobium leguminosarum TaxID=384 RepID=UPI00037FC5F2|nr:hypothetical protein [Rhizobium leguminosarum]
MSGLTPEQIFERDKVCYEQNSEQFRAMNQLMWQVPLVAMTVTGGLWYAAFDLDGAQSYKRALFALSGVLDLSLVFVLIRVRYVMGAYLEKMKAFHPNGFVSAPGHGLFTKPYTVIVAFSTALAVAALGSLIGLLNASWLQF